MAGAALLIGLILAAAGCGGGGPKQARRAFHVGLVFDVGGLGDKSFNDLAYAGLLRARDQLGVSFEYFEPTQGSERESALRLFAQGDADLIIGVGFLFTDDIRAVAADFPAKKFVCVDYTWTPGDSVPPNLVGLKFREEEGAYLVGALAAMVSATGTIGFVGGMDIPLIHKFEAGYRAGALHVNPATRVIVNYAGVTGDAFKNPSKGKELALAQYDQGADVIFHASGSTGLGVFEAARQKQKLAIGVDADQAAEAPGLVLTSMTKNVDVVVFQEIEAAASGHFEGGVRVLGLAEGAVGYVRNESNARWLTPERVERLDAIRGEIIAGAISVPRE
jgi:basic membrane protein A